MRTTTVKIANRAYAFGRYFDSVRELAESTKGISSASRDGIFKGDTSRVKRSDETLDRIEVIEQLADCLPQTERAVAGGLADVPAYLMGSPVAMRRRRKQEAHRPLIIVVDAVTSGGIDWRLIERRGVAVLALLRKLEATGHPVTLHIGAAMQCHGQPTTFNVARMDSQPIDLARACWVLCDADMQRDVFFKAGWQTTSGKTSDYGISWPYHDFAWNRSLAQHSVAWGQVIGETADSVLVVPPVFLDEARHFATDETAAAWVNMRYAEIVNRTQEEL